MQAGLHLEQMANRYAFERGLAAQIGKVVRDRLIEALDRTLGDGDSNEGRQEPTLPSKTTNGLSI